ncbi:MAG: hypothetical protein JWR19_2027 [Pedosphaera sp.]|nr:hypothetical protein [Pedosphaera sp.]
MKTENLGQNCLYRCIGTNLVLLLILLTSCRTAPPILPVNLAAPGWTTRQGQAVWRPKKEGPEIAGELLVATRPDGASFVQFTKTPLPFVVAQTTSNSWQIHIVLNNKTYSGNGTPPARLLWLHLPRCLSGSPPPKFWQWQLLGDDSWRLSNQRTGEFLEGYLSP